MESRGQQLDNVLETDMQRLRTSQVSALPHPHNIQDVHSPEYRAWFLSRAEGVDIQYSANASGHSPFAGLTRDQIMDVLRECGFGPFAERQVTTANVNMPDKQNSISRFDDFEHWSEFRDATLIRKATCTFCNDEFLHDAHNTCSQNDEQPVRPCQSIRYCIS